MFFRRNIVYLLKNYLGEFNINKQTCVCHVMVGRKLNSVGKHIVQSKIRHADEIDHESNISRKAKLFVLKLLHCVVLNIDLYR